MLFYETLELRRLLVAVYPSATEQYLVELINRGRADPSAEAARYGVALNEGLAAGTISTAAKQPLAINPFLTSSARGHSQWMIDTDTFSHTGSGGSDPGNRMTAAGYAFTGSWTWGENIGYRGTTGTPNQATMTAQIHQDLFVDSGITGCGHRTNLMSNSFREIGSGIVTGAFQSYNAVMATEDFATSGTNVFLTGVAYTDATIKDSFYTPGEGISGVTITATGASDNAVFNTTSWTSGGYSLALPAGTYTVTGSGGSLGGTVTYGNVVVGSQNVKRDFAPAMISNNFAVISGGVLTVTGTSLTDAIDITISGGSFTIKRNLVSTTLFGAGVTRIVVSAGDGDDAITIGAGVLACYVDAGIGNDFVQGGDANDTLTGGAGKDRLFGGLGDDRINGSGGHDKLYGEPGKDRLYGGEGNDTLDGGSSTDRLFGEGGNDSLLGQGGDDYLYARDSLLDTVYGGAGTDHAQLDLTDTRGSIEDLLA